MLDADGPNQHPTRIGEDDVEEGQTITLHASTGMKGRVRLIVDMKDGTTPTAFVEKIV